MGDIMNLRTASQTVAMTALVLAGLLATTGGSAQAQDLKQDLKDKIKSTYDDVAKGGIPKGGSKNNGQEI